MTPIILAGMTESIINFFRALIGNDPITIILVSMIPIVELRGAIPMAIQMGMHPLLAFLYGFIGCAIVVPILLLLLKPFINWMKRTKGFKTFALAIEGAFEGKVKKVESNASKSMAKSLDGDEAAIARKKEWKKLIAVGIFVALPIPMTGVWTGSAIAVFMGLSFWKSFATVMAGNLVAGTIITLLSFFLQKYLDTILMAFFILVLVVLALFILKLVLKMIKIKKQNSADKNIQVDASTGQSQSENIDSVNINEDAVEGIVNLVESSEKKTEADLNCEQCNEKKTEADLNCEKLSEKKAEKDIESIVGSVCYSKTKTEADLNCEQCNEKVVETIDIEVDKNSKKISSKVSKNKKN